MRHRILVLFAICMLVCACDEKKHKTHIASIPPASNTAPIVPTPNPTPVTGPAVLTVNHIGTKVVPYSQAPAWFVQVQYQLQNSSMPHIIIEEMSNYNGQFYGTVRAIDLSDPPDYDVFYDGAAPSGRDILCYPGEVSGVNWYNGMAWVDHNPFPAGVTPWHLDVSWPQIYTEPRAGQIIQADMTAAVHWTVDVSNTSVVTVTIP